MLARACALPLFAGGAAGAEAAKLAALTRREVEELQMGMEPLLRALYELAEGNW